MLKADSLILLVNSLTKAEKKNFKSYSKNSDYLVLFNLIEKNPEITIDLLHNRFIEVTDTANFDIAVSYLYKRLLDNLLRLREEQDDHYSLFNKILKARVLFEKSLFEEALDLLANVKGKAKEKENYNALLYASRLELEFLLVMNFTNISEKELLNKHFDLGETIKYIRRINEQFSLYELLKHRIIYLGNIRSQKQKESMNDLVVSEMSIVANSGINNFEINKLHQLFQSNYLIGIGDYKSAMNSYSELNKLFENNKHLWHNPPIYYIQVLEGILDTLRSIRKYDEIPYYIAQLEKINHSSVNFQANVTAITFLYKLFPMLDNGDFKNCIELMNQYNDKVLDKVHLLNLPRQAEVRLYQALIYIGINDLKKAQKFIRQIIIKGKFFYNLPLYRTIRLVNLMINYELNNYDFIDSEIRSIKREINKVEKAYRLERLMLKFLSKQNLEVFFKKTENTWGKLAPELESLRYDIFERQILKLFDFTAWIESKIRKTHLSQILKERLNT